MSTKICRIGHRNPNKGVITIASTIEDTKLYYGVSYCSPKEKKYNKKLGNDLALHELSNRYRRGIFTFFDQQIKHSYILNAILHDIVSFEEYPRWAEDLIIEQLDYPIGLKRYPNDMNNFKCPKFKIVVDSEETKEQFILALKYIHDLGEVDTDFVLVNQIAHVYWDEYLGEKIIEIDPNL
jgi:hypothetical protein